MSSCRKKLFIFVVLFCGSVLVVNCINLDYLDPIKLQTHIPSDKQAANALKIIDKIISTEYYTHKRFNNDRIFNVRVDFSLYKDHKDVFKLKSISEYAVLIEASSGVAAVWGFNYYLKKYCNSHIGWQNRRVVIPSRLPEVDEIVVASDRFRYYQNVCTVSYSFVWWGSDEWIEHITWMALNGINLSLAPLAQEAIWLRLYKRYGMTDEEINEHFTGPAFLSWLRMGNMRGWGGPLTQNWHDRTIRIQTDIIETMTGLGMIPVLAGFAGHVPVSFRRIFPKTQFHEISPWANFRYKNCCPLLIDPNEDLFALVAKDFLEESKEMFGSYNFYTADPFNEVRAANMTPQFLKGLSKSIFKGMNDVDSTSVWLLQNWMFVNEPESWPIESAEAFLNSVPNGRLLILDLQSEFSPQYKKYKMYFGHPFIWCLLHNFGGTLGMFGNLDIINSEVPSTRNWPNSSMIGIGLTMEGINQNYVVYDLMLENGWRKTPHSDLKQWISEYAYRRYGSNNTGLAWQYLLKGVYNYSSPIKNHGKYVLTRKPSMEIKPWAWYKNEDIVEAWKLLIYAQDEQMKFASGYYHDVVDLTRQVLQYRIDQYYILIKKQYINELNSFETRSNINTFLELMDDMANVLGTNNNFKALKWLDGARNINGYPSSIYEFNAKNQITLWGPNGEINDYACKQWSEMVRFYYKRRWEHFFHSLKTNRHGDEDTVERQTIREFYDSDIQQDGPKSDFSASHLLARQLFHKWAYIPYLDDLPFLPLNTDDSNDVFKPILEMSAPSVAMQTTNTL